MNVSLNHLVFNVLEKYRANLKDTDSLDPRQVGFWVGIARALLIKQRLDKNIFNIYEEEIQSIPDLEISQEVTGIVSTDEAIPVTINRKGYQGTLTKVVYPYTGDEPAFSANPVQIVTQKRFERIGNRKFNASLYYATIGKGNQLYLKTYTKTGSEKISVEGVFQNPIEVMEMNGVTDPYNADYPINSDLIKDLTNMIVSDNFQLVVQQMEDKTPEDGRDSTTK
jgi:hypothetical protein